MMIIINEFTRFTTVKATAVGTTATTAGWRSDFSGAVATFTDGQEDYGFVVVGFGAHVESIHVHVDGIYCQKRWCVHHGVARLKICNLNRKTQRNNGRQEIVYL